MWARKSYKIPSRLLSQQYFETAPFTRLLKLGAEQQRLKARHCHMSHGTFLHYGSFPFTYVVAESKESSCPLVLPNKNLGRASRTSVCLTIGRLKNRRRTSKNFEIFWTPSWLRK